VPLSIDGWFYQKGATTAVTKRESRFLCVRERGLLKLTFVGGFAKVTVDVA